MPPSPAMRCSPGREQRAGTHLRGRSLEGPITYRDKDDDLELFNEVQTKERDNFLLQSNDDFEDLFSSKLRYFSDYKLGIPKPSAGESSDLLLNAEGDKNDYDWLLTPPDTPLFTSLDDETHPVCLPLRGRPRSQPISISRSSTMEKSHRGSASPNRMSLSPGSSHTTSQSRGRPSSLPGASPPPSLRHATPTRRPSPPPSKPAQRSFTPSPRRMSTGSSSGPAVSSRVKGNSPAKSGGRISSSPKIKAWQANIPGFSSEVPPNLRTSLGDRPASYVRGSSPASRNGSKSGRQSMSPTASRSVSSSHSHERGKLSSDSKGSVASSGDDDVESLLSIPVSSSDRSSPRNLNTSLNNRSLGSSKKPTRTVTSSSAPKRSLDMAMRQMDHQKGPYNMFRPLLSSVPSSTFSASKSGAVHRTTASGNSSITTSSNASSELGVSVGHGTVGIEPKQENRASERMNAIYPDMHEEVFLFDQTDSIREDDHIHEEMPHRRHDHIHEEMPHRRHDDIDDITEPDTLGDETSERHGLSMEISAASEVLNERHGISTDIPEDIVLCIECGSRFLASETIEGEPRLCKDCKGLEIFSSIADVPKIDLVDTDSPGFSGLDVGQYSGKDGESVLARQLLIDPHTVSSCIVDEENCSQKLQKTDHSYANSKADVTEGVGIPLLLRSSSGKGPILRSRNFTASSMTFDDFSHMRDNATSTRSSVGHGSVSTSSSMDLGSTKQSEARFLRQLSGRKSDNGGYKSELYMKHQHSVSSLSETSTPAFPVSSFHEEIFEASVNNAQEMIADAICMDLQEHGLHGEAQEGDGLGIDIESNGNGRTVSDLSSSSMSIHVRDASMASASIFEDSDLLGRGENPTNSCINGIEQDASSTQPEDCPGRVDVAETNEDDVVSPDSVFDVGSHNSKSSLEDLQEEPSQSVASVEDSTHQKHTQITLDDDDDGQGGNHKRSFTLEEATDAILFCRSIVHNLAYEAATLAVEKDTTTSLPLEPLQPVITVANRWDHPRSRRRSSKSQRPSRQKTAVETDSKPPPVVFDNVDDESGEVSSARIVGANSKGDTVKPLKLESKCNCAIM